MTEKRFKHHMGLICEKRDEEYYSFTVKEVCDLLNALNDENEQLKQRNNFLKKQLDRVCSENEIMGDKLKKIGRTL